MKEGVVVGQGERHAKGERHTNWSRVKAGQAFLGRVMRAEEYMVTVCGREYLVMPEVFPADKFHSTQFFTRNLAVRAGDEVLEIGSGIGVTAIELALRGAGRVVATDLFEAAVLNTARNAGRLGVGELVEARAGDLFAPVLAGERFDLIYWNLPFVYVPESYEYSSLSERSIFDAGYRQTRRFVADAGGYLKPGGRLCFGFADFGEVDLMEGLLREHGYAWQVRATLPSWEGSMVHYLLYEARSEEREEQCLS